MRWEWDEGLSGITQEKWITVCDEYGVLLPPAHIYYSLTSGIVCEDINQIQNGRWSGRQTAFHFCEGNHSALNLIILNAHFLFKKKNLINKDIQYLDQSSKRLNFNKTELMKHNSKGQLSKVHTNTNSTQFDKQKTKI